jgi:chromosome segregation ATPase
VLSSKDAKGEARFAGRLDVLTERVDTLAATVATTASAMAMKDGEIASLKRELEARDRTLGELASRIEASAPPDQGALRELRETVAKLSADGMRQEGSKQVDDLAAKIGLLGQRLETLSTTVSTTAAGLAGREDELATIRKRLEERPAGEGQPPSDELRAMLTSLRAHVESLDGLRSGVSEEQLEERVAETDRTLSRLAQRLELLAEKVERSGDELEQKEHELAAVHRHFLESSSRVETIVDDLREALSALPDTEPDALSALESRLVANEHETGALARHVEQLAAVRVDESDGKHGDRLDSIERRVSALAEEIGRAKTLWPVALRSLEARLDDVAHRQEERAAAPVAETGDDPQDLLAGLRDSLQAMESVAAELDRASETESEEEPAHIDPAGEGTLATEVHEPTEVHEAVGGGARVVPLRQGDP